MLTIRQATLGRPDMETRSVPLVLATDRPVDRPGFIEVLDVSSIGVDLSRGDLPLIESHDTSRVNIGQVRNIRAEGGKLRGVAVFGKSARADEVLQDVLDGVVTGVSIGYQLLDEGQPVALRDGRAARKFSFMPYEVSVVAVPADTSAGFFRSHPITTKPIMEKTIDSPTQAADIIAIARTFPGGESLAFDAIERGLTVEQFQAECIRHLSTKPLTTADHEKVTPAVVAGKTEATGAKLLRSSDDFLKYYSPRTQRAEKGLTLAEFLRGAARMRTSSEATRALSVGVDTAGGYLVPTVLMPQILSALAPASSLMQAGASIVPLDMGGKSFNFAAVDVLPTAAWRAENGQVAESGPTFRNVVMTPTSLSFVTKVSRELLADGRNMETALYQAIGQSFAKEIDRSGLRGTGTSPEPRGLRNTTGIQAITNGANGAQFPASGLGAYAPFFRAAEAILEDDASMPTAAIMSPRAYVQINKMGDSTGQPVQVPPFLAGMRMLTSSQIPNNLTVGTSNDCTEIYVGDFSNLVFGMREQLSIQVLEEAYADVGQVGFMCHARLDVAVLYPSAFALVTGMRPSAA